ncbi:MAG: HAD-IA family hydrolase [Mariniblastus sp.]|nr:HAD-IA family hydrolase [Mariniblastus sp.]
MQSTGQPPGMPMDRPRSILFDAVGTIIYPDPDVLAVYHRLGQQHGSQLAKDVVESRFKRLRRTVFQSELTGDSTQQDLSRFEFPSSQQGEKKLWQDLVQHLFSDISETEPLFDQLWQHFADPDHWRVYQDVPECWASLQQAGIAIGVASNFDNRLEPILAGLGLNDLASQVFHSAQLGFRKPDLRFYRAIEATWPSSSILMVGDDYLNDYLAPRLCGWQSLQLVRQKERRTTNSINSLENLVERF